MMKVLQFPVRDNAGGVTKYILNNWKYIDKSRFHFDFVTLNKSLSFETELMNDGAEVYHITCSAESDEQEFRRQLGCILEKGYDAIHIHTGAWKSTAVEEVAKEHGISKIIIHAHNSGYVTNVDFAEAEKLLEKHEQIKKQLDSSYATDYWACSRKAADWLFGNNISPGKIKILNDAVETERFRYSEAVRKLVREELQIKDKFVIGHVGRFSKQKNHEFLLKVFAKVHKKNDAAFLLLIGVGELENDIRELAHQLEIENSVRFLGRRNDVEELYQAMDLFALPSNFEGLGIVLIEAQASGLKCLTSEFTPKEAGITENLKYLELDEEIWVKSILDNMEGYERKDCADIVQKAGYEIKSQIKMLEELYSQ